MNRTVRAGSSTISVFVLTTPVASLIKGFVVPPLSFLPTVPRFGEFSRLPASNLCFWRRTKQSGYAETRARLRTGEVRIFDSTGKVERVIAFDDTNRRL